MTERFEAIITHELSTPYQMSVGTGTAQQTITVPRWETIETPANVLPFLDVRHGSVQTSSLTYPFEMTVGEHLTSLARSGVDFTAVGRKLLVWDSESALGETRIVTEDDFSGDLVVISSGASLASISHAVGQTSEDPDTGEELAPPVGHAGGVDTYYGVWERVVSSQTEMGGDASGEQTVLTTQAQRDLLGRTPAPLEIRADENSLILSDTLLLSDLVPGVVVPVVATMNLRRVSQRQLLDSITVTEEPQSETIKPVLVPAGTVEAL